MKVFDWMRAGPAIRGTPPRGRFRGRSLIAVGLLAIFALSETGCQSGGCGNCGFLRRTTSRITSRFSRSTTASCCGDTVAGETFVGDAPVTTVPSAGVIVPAPSSTVPSTSPTIEDAPSSLDPIPKAKIEPRTSLLPGKSSSSYDAARPATPAGRPRANNNLVQSSDNNPVPASRSARGSAVDSQIDGDNPLDRLPPLDLPTEVTERTQTPPAPPVAERASVEKPASSAKPDASSSAKKLEIKATEPEKTSGSSPTLPLEASNTGTAAPGIKHLVAVDLKLSGGSAPTREGLDWLADKGYKTLLDLREPSEVESSFIADVTNRGIRYIPLPMNVRALDNDHVARFNFELANADARPLFFFDSDGSRPGALWYVRRITKDNVDPQIARREAEEIGLSDKAFWLAAKSYVEKTEAAKIGQLPNDSDLDPETKPASTSTSTPEQAKPSKAPSASSAAVVPSARIADAAASRELSPKQLETKTLALLADLSGRFKSQTQWQPLAAMMMTGLTVPLAYWNPTAMPLVFTNPVPSLTAVERQSKALPSSSGG